MRAVVLGGISGVLAGAILTALFVVPRAVSGVPPPTGLTWPVLGVAYLVGLGVAGVIAGSLAGFADNWLGGGLIGWLALAPLVFTFFVMEGGVPQETLQGSAVVSGVIGFPVGVALRALIKEVDPFGPID